MLKTINGGKMCTKATRFSAAVDLYANADVVIKAGETCKVPLGVCIDIDFNEIFTEWNNYTFIMQEDKKEEFLQSHYLQLEPRSSLRAKGLIAGTGVIDLDYIGHEIMIIIHNPVTGINDCDKTTCICSPNATAYRINKGEKIAQIMLCEHKSILFGIESDTERTNGFGSTGDK